MVHAIRRAECETCGRVGNSGCETVDSNLHLGPFSRTTFISIHQGTTPLCHLWLKHFGLTPVPRLSARFPIFFNVVSRARNSFGLASAKTFLISASCLRKVERPAALASKGQRIIQCGPMGIGRAREPYPAVQQHFDRQGCTPTRGCRDEALSGSLDDPFPR